MTSTKLVCTARRRFLLVFSVFLAGCGEHSTLAIRPQGSLDDSTSLAGLRLEVGARALSARDFRAGSPVTIHVPDEGELIIRLQLSQDGRVATSGEFQWTMARKWEWGLDILRGVEDPVVGCFGCAGSARFPLPQWAASQEGESVWVAWGGRPKGSDVVF